MIQRGNLWESPAGLEAIDRIILRGKAYWTNNVYNHYKRDTGKLGGACAIKFTNGTFVVGMTPLLDIESGRDYGRSIRKGIPPGPGGYNPEKGVREVGGWYPGVATTKFWVPWMREFEPAFKRIVAQETRRAAILYVNQSLRGVP